MGLDMYLTNKTYIPNDGKWEIQILKDGKPSSIDVNKISSIEEEVGYWRKANAIHKWFVKNVQDGKDDCQDYYVSKEKINQLITDCKNVLEDHTKASSILPTGSGFFFGSTEYDEWYFDDINKTLQIMQQALQILDGENYSSIYYRSSWQFYLTMLN